MILWNRGQWAAGRRAEIHAVGRTRVTLAFTQCLQRPSSKPPLLSARMPPQASITSQRLCCIRCWDSLSPNDHDGDLFRRKTSQGPLFERTLHLATALAGLIINRPPPQWSLLKAGECAAVCVCVGGSRTATRQNSYRRGRCSPAQGRKSAADRQRSGRPHTLPPLGGAAFLARVFWGRANLHRAAAGGGGAEQPREDGRHSRLSGEVTSLMKGGQPQGEPPCAGCSDTSN